MKRLNRDIARPTTSSLLGLLRILMVAWVLSTPRLAADPLDPAAEARTFQFADPRLTVELVAAEPDVESPVAIAWDASGQCFVAEMRDYPVGPASGRIRLLRDRNGDGRVDEAQTFAEGLAFPNSVLPWRGGILVTVAPDLIYLRDHDGDGRADDRRTLLRGFGEGNQQLRANGLIWGLDGWVYGANGRSDGELQRCDTNGNPVGPRISLKGRDFRFRPETGELEPLAGRSQFGLALDDWGRRFLSWNTIPVRHEVIPERYLDRHPQHRLRESLQDLLPPNDDQRIYPATPSPRTFNQESTLHFNALSGLTLYRGDALAESDQPMIFVGESLRNLVHRRLLVPRQATFHAVRMEQGREFLASTDPWFHPVNFATGPDGALYVIDFYRQWVEHPDFVHPPEKRSQVDWRTGASHGRIWRVVRRDQPPPPRRVINLDHAPTPALVDALEHSNGWIRDTARRLLFERRDPNAIPLLKDRLGSNAPRAPEPSSPARSALARRQSLWLLEREGQLSSSELTNAWRDRDPGVIFQALQISESRLRMDPGMAQALMDLPTPLDPAARLQYALSLGGLDTAKRLPRLAQLLGDALAFSDRPRQRSPVSPSATDGREHGQVDTWLARAVVISTGPDITEFMRLFLALDSGALSVDPILQTEIYRELGYQTGRVIPWPSLHSALPAMARRQPQSANDAIWTFIAGLTEGNQTGSKGKQPIDSSHSNPSWIENWRQVAEATLSNPSASDTRRIAALQILESIAPAAASQGQLQLIQDASTSEPVHREAIRRLAATGDPSHGRRIAASWSAYPVRSRRLLLSGWVNSARWSDFLIEALERKAITLAELDPLSRRTLLRLANPTQRARIEVLFGNDSALVNRSAVVEKFRPAITLRGDRARGKTIFEARCAACHVKEAVGTRVGPDLLDLSSRGRETTLIDILDPNRVVPPEYLSYRVTLRNDEPISALILAESGAELRLRQPNLPDRAVPRSDVVRVEAESRSLMPEGLEVDLDVPGMADLLDYLVGAPEASDTNAGPRKNRP